jgi:hypothetical protein
MRLLFALTIPLALVAPLAAAEPLDRLLSMPGIAQLPDGVALVYRHRRADGHPGRGASERSIRLERHAGRASVVATLAGDGARPFAEFRGTTGNPIVLVFLDSVVSGISEAIGGNPFYLRRRIKEAARSSMNGQPVTATHGGSELPAQEIILRPFEGADPGDELGMFATLELTFLLSDAVPGRFLSLRATAGEGTGSYTEEMLLDGTT